MDALAKGGVFLFETFRLDRQARALFRRDEGGVFVPVAVGSRALDVLGVLVGRAGELVSRDEFMRAVWPATAVEDTNLNTQIAALRRVLDERRTDSSCIQTVPGRGYRFVGTVTREGRGSPPRLSIVVLPFTNLSKDREQQYFADAITADLTTDLSRIANMFVISCNTAFTYRYKPVATMQIGRELGVRYVLEGSIQRSGSHVRVNTQLIDAATDAHVWTARFDRKTSDLFALQTEITSRVSVAMNLELIAIEAARPTRSPDGFDYVLRGRAAMNKPRSRDTYAEAISQFEHALALDPGSGEAQSLLASVLVARLLDFGSSTYDSDLKRAAELSNRALAAAPRSPVAHFARGQLLRVQGRLESFNGTRPWLALPVRGGALPVSISSGGLLHAGRG
jgi:TolB-like protein